MPVKCENKSKAPRGFEIQTLGMIEPHSLVAYLFNDAGIYIDQEKIEAFWKHHQDVQSPFLESFDGTNGHIPIGLYGDGARARQQAYMPVEKVVGIFLNLPLWRPKSARYSRFLLFSIQEDLCFGRKTLNAVYRRIVWSLNHMFLGQWPTHAPDGSVLTSKKAGQSLTPDGKMFALTEHRGDWCFFKWVLGFKSSWKAGTNAPVCYRCAAYGSGDPSQQYYHIGENAPCWRTEYNNVEFICKEMPDVDVCHLFQLQHTCMAFWGFTQLPAVAQSH